jgi:hypothetical protein
MFPSIFSPFCSFVSELFCEFTNSGHFNRILVQSIFDYVIFYETFPTFHPCFEQISWKIIIILETEIFFISSTHSELKLIDFFFYYSIYDFTEKICFS